MTNEEAIEILIAVAVCDRPILSCDFCARYAGIGTHCNYPTDEEIEEAVLLLKGASKDMAISALRQQETVTNRNGLNEPLTNAQKIRAMTNEELAKLLCCTGWRMIEREECLEWLQQPAEEDDHA